MAPFGGHRRDGVADTPAIAGGVVSGAPGTCSATVAVLFDRSSSSVSESTVTVFVMVLPTSVNTSPAVLIGPKISIGCGTTSATISTVAVAPGASALNVTRRSFAVPPQAPPPVAEHDTNPSDGGNASVTVTDWAAEGPRLATSMS